MGQLALFEKPPVVDPWGDLWAAEPEPLRVVASKRVPRWYQLEGIDCTLKAFEEFQSALLVLATGCGKTFIFSSIARDWNGNVLILAHRDELVRQAALNLEIETGECVGIEKAQERSDGQRLVVASVQSMNQARLDRLGKSRFSLVIADESHNFLAPTFRRAAEYFDAKLLGVTATPDRGDEKSLGQLFETVAYCFDILQGIESGYLVRVDAQQVHLDAIDLNGVDTSAGDFVAAQLDEVMLKCVEGVCTEVLRISGSRQGVIFWPGVRSAEHAANRMNSMRAGSAGWISGNTPEEERRETLRRYKSGELQFLHNCMILTEGFDAPNTSVIAMARPTKSRKLYAQCAGRGTRVLPGIVDHLPSKDGAALRQQLIASSAKPSMLLLDFVGNAGKHSLMGPVDILGGDHSEDEIKEAKRRMKKDGGATDVRKALEEARARLKAAAAAITSKVQSRTSKFDPFAVLGVTDGEEAKYTRRFGFKPATVGQREGLKKWKFTEEDGLNDLSMTEARRIMDELGSRARAGLASYGQLKQLGKFGVTDRNITRERASAAMNYLAHKGWGKKGSIDPQALLSIIHHKRDAGDD